MQIWDELYLEFFEVKLLFGCVHWLWLVFQYILLIFLDLSFEDNIRIISPVQKGNFINSICKDYYNFLRRQNQSIMVSVCLSNFQSKNYPINLEQIQSELDIQFHEWDSSHYFPHSSHKKYKQLPEQLTKPTILKIMHSLYSTKHPLYDESTIMEPNYYQQPTFRSTKLESRNYNQSYEPTIRYPLNSRLSSYSFSMENNQPIGSAHFNQGRNHLADVSKCSSVSAGSFPKSDEVDCARQLAELQQKLTQQILVLREQKLTLMQQQNATTANRYKLQRQLNKLKKNGRQLKIGSNQAQEDQVEKLYNEQVENRKMFETKKEQVQNVDYENLTSEECQIMEKILNLKQTNNELMIEIYKQDVGSDKLEKKLTKSLDQMEPGSYLQSLRAKKEKLLTTLLSQTRHQSLITSVLTLLHTNQQLQTTVNKYIYRERHRLQLLRERVKQEQEEKKKMLENLIKMKSQLKSLKMENEEFKKAMIYFRF